MEGGIDKVCEDEITGKTQKRSWSNVPIDILSSILSRLVAGDSVVFSLVCKTWKSVPIRRKNISQPIIAPDQSSSCPCLFLHSHFFHPLYNVSFQMESFPVLPEGIIHSVNYGWLLMTRGENNAFFFNPFTNERVDLPGGEDYTFRSVAFSSPPTSSDCEVVSFKTDDYKIIYVQTIKRGEEETTYIDFKLHSFFRLSKYCNPVFYKGRYYCMGMEGNLMIYDARKRQCWWSGSPKHLWKHFNWADRHFLFESEGDLWSVSLACHGREVCVCRLNNEKLVWDMVDDLEDRMVFVSHPASFIERATVKGAGNKIYFPRFRENGSIMFYSLATKKYHTFERGTCYETFTIPQGLCSTWIKIGPTRPETAAYAEELSW